ncbi:MAG: ECF-type sigma factor [Candidatus Wenzhouxiangella sp. M2_3B_020]
MKETAGELTQALRRWSAGDERARDELVERAYGELKRLARSRLAGEREAHTLQPTALVHEAWMKLAQGEAVDWQDRAHFIAVSARVMRQILVDSGRKRHAAKRQPAPTPTMLLQTGTDPDQVVDVLDLDRALARLEKLDATQARLVELRYFGGLSIPETAAVLDVSVATANRYWRAARAWLYLRLSAGVTE